MAFSFRSLLQRTRMTGATLPEGRPVRRAAGAFFPHLKGFRNLRRWQPAILQDDATASPGLLSMLGTALGNVVQQVAPVYTAALVAKEAAKAQGQVLKVQASNLYTPANIQTLYDQQRFEAAQRGVQAGRDTGTVSAPIPWGPIAAGLAVLAGGYLLLRKR